MSETEFVRRCPDCDEEMHEVRVVESVGFAVAHRGLEYTLIDTKRGRWSARYPAAGRVMSLMCPACGRIVLYGSEYEE